MEDTKQKTVKVEVNKPIAVETLPQAPAAPRTIEPRRELEQLYSKYLKNVGTNCQEVAATLVLAHVIMDAKESLESGMTDAIESAVEKHLNK